MEYLVKFIFRNGPAAICGPACYLGTGPVPVRKCRACGGSNWGLGRSAGAENTRRRAGQWKAALALAGREITGMVLGLDAQVAEELFPLGDIEWVPVRPPVAATPVAAEPEFDPAAVMDQLFDTPAPAAPRRAA